MLFQLLLRSGLDVQIKVSRMLAGSRKCTVSRLLQRPGWEGQCNHAALPTWGYYFNLCPGPPLSSRDFGFLCSLTAVSINHFLTVVPAYKAADETKPEHLIGVKQGVPLEERWPLWKWTSAPLEGCCSDFIYHHVIIKICKISAWFYLQQRKIHNIKRTFSPGGGRQRKHAQKRGGKFKEAAARKGGRNLWSPATKPVGPVQLRLASHLISHQILLTSAKTSPGNITYKAQCTI